MPDGVMRAPVLARDPGGIPRDKRTGLSLGVKKQHIPNVVVFTNAFLEPFGVLM